MLETRIIGGQAVPYMTDEIEIFKNEQFGEVRVISKDNEAWLCLKDVCNVLGIKNVSDCKSRLNQKGVVISDTLTTGGTQKLTYINESNFYKVIFQSRKEEAEKFQEWVTDEVLPTIRKTGGYVNNDDLFIKSYLPFADDATKEMFRSTLATVRKQNEMILKQQKTIEYKENVIIGLVDEVTLAEKRQILNRVVRYKGANFQERWRELYRQFEMKYHIDLTKRLESYNTSHKPKMKNKIDYIDKVMNKIPELYEVACKLYENDVKELAEELYFLN
jgi:prophage antirepressor-like protein